MRILQGETLSFLVKVPRIEQPYIEVCKIFHISCHESQLMLNSLFRQELIRSNASPQQSETR